MSEVGWQRLSLWSALHFFVRTVSQLTNSNNAVAIAAVVVALWQSGYFFPGLGAGGALLFLNAFLQHRYFLYRIDADQVQVKSGVLSKKQTTLRFERIQNVAIEEPWYFRPLSLVSVKVDGAGSGDEEVMLSALSREAALATRDQLLAHRSAGTGTERGETDDEDGVLIRRDLPDLVINGLVSNRAWVILAGVFAVFGQLEQALDIDIGVGEVDVTDMAVSAVVFYALGAVAVLAVSVLSLSVLGSIVLYYDFTLRKTGSEYGARFGLLNKQELHLQQSRVQSMVFKQGLIASWFARLDLVYEQIAHQSGNNPGQNRGRLLVPSVTYDDALRLARDCDAETPDVRALDFTRPNIRYWLRQVAGLSLIYGIAVSAILLDAEDRADVLVPLVGFAFLLHAGFAYLTYLRLGVAIDGERIVLRRGLFVSSYTAAPLYKVQRVRLRSSLFMERSGFRSVDLQLASGALRVHYVPLSFAETLADYAAYQVEREARGWM